MNICVICKVRPKVFGMAARYCKFCSKQENKRKQRLRGLKYRFNITSTKLEDMIAQQKGKCLLCKSPIDFFTNTPWGKLSPVVDHRHSCCSGNKSCGRCIRGIIHRRCNIGLGMFDDNPNLLRLAIEYLENHVGNSQS